MEAVSKNAASQKLGQEVGEPVQCYLIAWWWQTDAVHKDAAVHCAQLSKQNTAMQTQDERSE